MKKRNQKNPGAGQMPAAPKVQRGTIGRLVNILFRFYPVLMPVTLVCIVFTAVVSSIPALFMQQVIQLISKYMTSGDWSAASGEIIPLEVTELDEDGQPAAFELVEDQAIAQEVYEDFKQAAKDLYDFE